MYLFLQEIIYFVTFQPRLHPQVWLKDSGGQRGGTDRRESEEVGCGGCECHKNMVLRIPVRRKSEIDKAESGIRIAQRNKERQKLDEKKME